MIEQLRNYVGREVDLLTLGGPVRGKLKQIIVDRVLELEYYPQEDYETTFVDIKSIQDFRVRK